MLRRATLLAWLSLFFVLPARADETLSLLNFSVNGVGVTQSDGGEVFSGQINWTPELSFAFGLAVRAELGAGLLKNEFGDRFVTAHYQLFAHYDFFSPVFLEAGAGLETWAGNGGTNALLSANGGVHLPYFLDRIFIGFSYFCLPGAPAKEFKLGAGFTF